MANKYYLASVGTVEAFRHNEATGRLELAFRSKTLTDSGINISITKDDIRAGQDAPIVFSYYHDPSIEVNLTDVVFDPAYVEAQLGTEFKRGTENGAAYVSEGPKTAASGKVTLAKDPQPLSVCGSSETLVWFSEKGSEDWRRVADSNLSGQEVSGLTDGVEYCFRYLAENPDALIAQITSEIIPQELFLVVTAPVFSGDACSASNGKKAGTITYEIPRFKLNGAQDFAMNMSSNQTMSLAGNVLASQDSCDIGSSNLLRVILALEGEHWYSDVNELVVDEDSLKVGLTPVVYGLRQNGRLILVDNDELTFSGTATYNTTTGKWTADGEATITATGKPELTDTVTVASAE